MNQHTFDEVATLIKTVWLETVLSVNTANLLIAYLETCSAQDDALLN